MPLKYSQEAFTWIPRTDPIAFIVKIGGVDKTQYITSIEWTKTLCPEIGLFKMSLININGDFNYLDGGEVVQIYTDFADGTTKRFEGKIERPGRSFKGDYMIEARGSHISSGLLDITVTYSSTTTGISDVLKAIIDTYLTGYTYTNISTVSIIKPINWQNKPFWDCVKDLVDLSGYDCYVDDSKDFHLFLQGSILNEDEAITYNDALRDLSELGPDLVDIKNKIIVIGDDGTGLPILYTKNDTSSQTTYGVKELPIRDTNIRTSSMAEATAIANQSYEPIEQGKAKSSILPSLNPGDKVWISDPVHDVHNQYRIIKFTHKWPALTTDSVIGDERNIPKLLKLRVAKELALENVLNPNKYTYSENYLFDDESQKSSMDSNLTISEGKLKMLSGQSGIFTSVTTIIPITATQFQVKASGENLSTITIVVSWDGSSTTSASLDAENTIDSDKRGTRLNIVVTLNSTSTQVDSIAILYK